MSDDRDNHYQGQLLRWEMMYGAALHSDRLAAEIGIFGLKALLLIHGGALVALLAAYPELRNEPAFANAIPCAGRWLLGGLVSAAISTIVAYFYQSFITAKDWNSLHEIIGNEEPAPYPHADRISRILAWPMIGFAILSLAAFVAGALPLLDAF